MKREEEPEGPVVVDDYRHGPLPRADRATRVAANIAACDSALRLLSGASLFPDTHRVVFVVDVEVREDGGLGHLCLRSGGIQISFPADTGRAIAFEYALHDAVVEACKGVVRRFREEEAAAREEAGHDQV